MNALVDRRYFCEMGQLTRLRATPSKFLKSRLLLPCVSVVLVLKKRFQFLQLLLQLDEGIFSTCEFFRRSISSSPGTHKKKESWLT